ncbi:ATP-dependent RNA helicase DHX30-like isoform X1 [Vespula squamosa]|uniref:ATP-dependent RNA helicase DHX30-like isoform X1 n=1 Tax=Vespula squamosa TaxID=30214 RepID=A0ABD2AU09_VESSQ
MFTYRVIFYKKGRTHCFIRPLVAWSRESFTKQFHPNKIKRCYSIKNKERELVNYAAKINRYETDESKKDTTNDKKLEKTEFSFEDMSTLYPNAFNSLKTIYSIVKNELNEKDLFQIEYVQYKNNNEIFWECILTVFWPKKKLFTSIQKNKSLASNDASLNCLYWLHAQNKLKHGKPIIYTAKEIKARFMKPIPIYLDSEILEEVKQLLQIYELNVKNIIKSPELKDDNFTLSTEKYSTDIKLCLRNDTRNQSLKKKLLEKDNMDGDLPIFQYREEIFQKLEKNNILLIRGNTGCGKTTQVPQFILDHYIKNGNASDCNILVSQPRRISAISLAERIAFERGEAIGDVIGYSVRLEQKYPKFPGGILFCTTGILCQIIQNNPNLMGYSHVILDEVHERSLDIDLLFLLLKRIVSNNLSLKLVLMSATINTELFVKYFNCDIIDVHGKMYPVKMHFLEDFKHLLPPLEKKVNNNFDQSNMNEDNRLEMVHFQDIINLIIWIIETKPPGTILCFLPGWYQIKTLLKLLNNNILLNQKLVVIPIHSKLSIINQERIFASVPTKNIKVVLATDIVETGITIPDVVYVIDTSIKNSPMWKNNKLYIGHQRISQANIQQRKGRAGRIKAGESYHFITKKEYNDLHPNPIPEMLCSSLENTIIKIKCHTNEKIEQFCKYMIEEPNKITIKTAIRTLYLLNILDINENLTPLGKRLSLIHVDPILGKALILSTIFKCTDPILSIVSLYSIDQDIFANTLYDKSSKKDIKKGYHETSDHMALIMLCNKWKNYLDEGFYKIDPFCRDMKINPLRVKLLNRIRNMLAKQLEISSTQNHYNDFDFTDDSKMLQNKDTYCEEIIYGIILSSTNMLLQYNDISYYRNMYRKKPALKTECDQLTRIMTESVNYNKEFQDKTCFVYFHGIRFQTHSFMLVYDTSVISPLTILLFGQGSIDNITSNNSNNESTIILTIPENKVLRFSCTPEVAEILISFREVIWSVVDYFLKVNDRPIDELKLMNEYRSEFLRVLSKMLNTKDNNNDTVIK